MKKPFEDNIRYYSTFDFKNLTGTFINVFYAKLMLTCMFAFSLPVVLSGKYSS